MLTDTIVGYFLAVSKPADSETSLPLSKISFPQSSSFGLENAKESFKKNLSYFPLSSPFCVHAFVEETSPAKLIHTSPTKLMLDWSHFPVIPQISNLNAYILDFYKHGDVSSMSKANMIRESVARKNLISFHRTLRKISNALEIQSPLDKVTRMFSKLSRSFEERLTLRGILKEKRNGHKEKPLSNGRLKKGEKKNLSMRTMNMFFNNLHE